MYEGITFTVVVPNGGVSEGQRFIVPFTPRAVAVAVPADSTTAAAIATAKSKHQGNGGVAHGIPTGIWRDGLCDCCRFGPFHPHFLCALCFKPCLLGQIMTRMKMTWLGKRTRDGSSDNENDSRIEVDHQRWKNTFRNIAIVTLVFYGIQLLTATPQLEDEKASGGDQQPLDKSVYYDQLSEVDKARYTVNSWISTLFAFYLIYIMIQLRATLRHVYSIPEESCLGLYQLGCGSNPREGICGGSNICTAGVPIGWEDICCSIWCQLCILGQMARHTVDYDEKGAVCCNTTGVMDWEDDEAYEGIEDGHVGEGSVLVV